MSEVSRKDNKSSQNIIEIPNSDSSKAPYTT